MNDKKFDTWWIGEGDRRMKRGNFDSFRHYHMHIWMRWKWLSDGVAVISWFFFSVREVKKIILRYHDRQFVSIRILAHNAHKTTTHTYEVRLADKTTASARFCRPLCRLQLLGSIVPCPLFGCLHCGLLVVFPVVCHLCVKWIIRIWCLKK